MLNVIKNYFITMSLSSLLICQCDSYEFGDANSDNNIDVVDIILSVDYILSSDEFNPLIDLNSDNMNNIFDIIILVERILSPFEMDVQFIDINFNYSDLFVSWSKTEDASFSKYNIYYSNFINNEEILLYTTDNIIDTSIVLNNIILNEQNYFYIGLRDITGCELKTQQTIYDLPFKHYLVGDNGQVEYTEFNINDFKPSSECMGCHEDHYNEWFSSNHSYATKSPLFFSCKEQVKNNYPNAGEKFCMQCHSPVSYLTGEDTSLYETVEDFQNSNLDEVIKDGIGCDICHTITGLSQTVYTEDNLFANAEYKMYPLGNIKFGSIQEPEENSFHASYYLPTYKSSQMCLPCHDLVIRDVEAEITFTEWSRIPGFSMFDGVSCQDCHMPLKENGYHSHKFVGVDIDLSIPVDQNEMFNDVKELLETSATISFGILENSIVDSVLPGTLLTIPVTIESHTAHSLPSGTSFNRQVWVELIILNNDEIIFESGKVASGEQLEFSDSNLLFFSTFLYDNQGSITQNVTDTYSMVNNSLLAYGTRYANYEKMISNDLTGELNVIARLLFRPFDPEFILEHHPEFFGNLPIYEISAITKNIILE